MAMAERTATDRVGRRSRPRRRHSMDASSGALTHLAVTWASRTERSDGRTSPEELIAAAHSSCFSMALAHGLTEAGHPPEHLEVRATVTLDLVDGAPTVTTSELHVTGRVPGLDQLEFARPRPTPARTARSRARSPASRSASRRSWRAARTTRRRARSRRATRSRSGRHRRTAGTAAGPSPSRRRSECRSGSGRRARSVHVCAMKSTSCLAAEDQIGSCSSPGAARR